MRELLAPQFDLSHITRLPGLLVSVRDAAEALTALEAGADVIDVKEPAKGSLGAADAATIESVVRTVAGRRPVTVALGELTDFAAGGLISLAKPLVSGVSLFKIGLAGCGSDRIWQKRWSDVIGEVTSSRGIENSPRPVAVAYADWTVAASAEPIVVLQAAIELGCPALLIDTWRKNGNTLFDCWESGALKKFVEEVRRHSMRIVLAGSLRGDEIAWAASLGPDLVAVRGAACSAGRNSTVCGERVRELKRILGSCEFAANK
jgi:hypothetical protein